MGGFFGTVSKEPVVRDLFYGTDYHSHLGTSRAGMVTYDEQAGFCRSIHGLGNNYFRTKFEPELDKFKGNAGIGVISDTDAQPMLVNSHLGRMAVVTVAKINNLSELAQELLAGGSVLTEFSSGRINPTELIGMLIVQGKTFAEGIEYMFSKIKGSCSLLILTEDGVIAARDSWGRTPIVVGSREDGAYALASESSSYLNLGFDTCRELGPGEILRFRPGSIEQLRKPNPRMQICSFLWVYYGFPTTCYEGINVETVRNKCGCLMGKKDDAQVDCACGIPDSGVGMAVGYAEGHNVPFARAINKYTPTWPRSFMPVDQSLRELVAKMKLIPNKYILKDKKVLFCDDSIVRGTQLRDNTAVLTELGAKEVHMRIACPPLLYACQFVNFSASKNEYDLITRRVIREFEGDDPTNIKAYATTDSPEYKRMVAEISKRFNLTSLRFSTIEDLVESIGLPKECICTHCFDGSSEFTLTEENK